MKSLRATRRVLHVLPLAALSMFAIGEASAQVSLSGRVDLTIAKSSPGMWQVMPGGSSRLIFRATDDLGGGTESYAYAQHRLNADDGTPKTPFWYSTYVGLRNAAYGDLRVGYQASPIDDATGSHFEVWDGDTLASRFSSIAGGLKITPNVVRYTTPNAYGFRVSVAEMPGEGATGQVTGRGASLTFDRGGFSAAYSVQRNQSKVFDRGLGVRYTGDNFRLFGTWAHGEYVGGNKQQTDVQLSAGYSPTPQGEIRVLYNTSKLADVTTKVESLGYFYRLSKRTAVLANYAVKKIDKKPTVDSYQVGLRVDF